MLKRVLLAAAVVFASPALVSAQDIFLTFDDTAVQSAGLGPAGTVGTVSLFAADGFGFDAADINITSSNTSVLQVTGGTGLNANIPLTGDDLFDSSDVTLNADGSVRFFAVNVTQAGINPGLNGFNPAFTAGVGVRLAEITYSVVSAGDATLDLSFGPQGLLRLPEVDLTGTADISSGSASFVAGPSEAIPEPTSLALLVLGSVGLVARRKRS